MNEVRNLCFVHVTLTKIAVIFEMKYLSPVDEDKKAMERVVLEEEEREMLMGMIGNDTIHSWNAEFIEGKGTGQVILLYGMYCCTRFVSPWVSNSRSGHPGTGKTFTVGECSAQEGILLSNGLRMCCETHKSTIAVTHCFGSGNRRDHYGS